MKTICACLIAMMIISCNNATQEESVKDQGTDTAALSNPVLVDTTKQPSGVDNSSVISTDTAAINVQNTLKKADSVTRKKK